MEEIEACYLIPAICMLDIIL